MYEEYKVYGPYFRKDGRQHVCLYHKDTGARKTISYPKYLMEIHLGKHLLPNETVDHIDCNFHNNDISNLRVLERVEHSKEDSKTLVSQDFDCMICDKSFELKGNKLSNAIANRKRGKSGPFCSKNCAGVYGQQIQAGVRKADENIEFLTPKYTTLKASKQCFVVKATTPVEVAQ